MVFNKAVTSAGAACLALAAAAGAPSAGAAPSESASTQSTRPASGPFQPAPERQRVQIRSVNAPVPAPAPVDEAPADAGVPAERNRSGAGGDAPTTDGSRESRVPAPAAVPQRAAATPTTTSSGTTPSPSRERTRPEPAASDDSLPARIVPRPVRRIVEVVPSELWAAIGGLALLALGFASWSWIAAARARRLRRQRESLLEEVGLLQAALLPSVPDGLPVSVAYRPVEGTGAGGDFYDAFVLPGGAIGLILGDVSGHGRDALARTTFVRYTLRAHLEAGLEPRAVLKVASDALRPHLDGGFATVALAVHDPASGRFTYACAGHAPPVVAGAGEPFEPVIACAAPPLGIGEPTGFRQSTFTLTAGSRACLYTDGVTEARAGGQLLGLARVEWLLATLPRDGDAQALLGAVAEAADEITDDIAICLVTAGADAPATGPRIEELEVDDEHEVGDLLERFLRACGVPLVEVPGVLRQAGEAARREGSVTVRVRVSDVRPGVDVVPGNVVRLAERRRALG